MSIQFLTPEISSASLLQGAIPDAEAKCCRAASDLSGVDWPLCTSQPASPLGPTQRYKKQVLNFLSFFSSKCQK